MTDLDPKPRSEPPAAARGRAGLRRLRFTALAVALGAGVAGAYAHLVGCRTGGCPLTSSVWTASLYGGLVGLFAGWPARRSPSRRDG